MIVTDILLTSEEIDDVITRAPGACRYWLDSFDTETYSDATLLSCAEGDYTLDHHAVKRGVRLALALPLVVAQVTKHSGNLCAVDQDCVDAIVQLGIFGKLVYG